MEDKKAEQQRLVADLQKDFGFKPATPLAEGLARFAAWYKGYYKKA